MSNNLAVALKYCEFNIAIFPCAPNKRPLLPNWLASASADAEMIRMWWTEKPDSLIGMPLKPLDLAVLDADRHEGGEDGVAALQDLIAKHGPLPPHPHAMTANRGEHHIFRQPSGEKIGSKKIVGGLETRGFREDNSGSYIIGAGSRLADGRCWQRAPGSPSLLESVKARTIPELPHWLEELLRQPQRSTNAPVAAPIITNSPTIGANIARHSNGSREAAFAQAALEGISRELAAAKAGERNNRLNSAAFRLGTMSARGWLQRAEIGDALWQAATACGLVADDGVDTVQATLASGLRAGEQLPHEDLHDRPERLRTDIGSTGNSTAAKVKGNSSGGMNGIAEGAGELESMCASSFKISAVQWLWPGRFALGKLGIITGLPDHGKGQLLADMASRVTRGAEWPCSEGSAPQGSVVILSSEDDPSDTVVPRLMAAGADLERVHFINMVRAAGKDRMFNLAGDLELLRKKIAEIGDVRLVQIDPISAYLGVGKVDTFRSNDVRAVLAPLCDLANEMMTSIVGVLHFNKKTDVTNALLRISDSLAFGAAARHVYAVIDDAENSRKLFVRCKNNLAPNGEALAYDFGVREVGHDAKSGEVIRAPHIVWHPAHVSVTASEAMQAASEAKSPGARDDAKKFLSDLLADGPVPRAEIDDASEAHGVSRRTLFRAKGELKVIARKDGPGGCWTWRLPERQNNRRAEL